MCIVREKCLSIDDLAFLIGSNVLACEPDEEAIQRSVAIHERAPAWQRSAQRLPASWNRSRSPGTESPVPTTSAQRLPASWNRSPTSQFIL